MWFLRSRGWKCGILICYDNNIIENVRATALLGGGYHFHASRDDVYPPFPSPRGWFDRSCVMGEPGERSDFLATGVRWPEGTCLAYEWLPARAYDNAVYVVFSNPIGLDYNEIKNGCSMILDPFGDIVAECRKLGDDFVIATAIPEKLRQAGGYRYRNARRPELYADIIGQPHESNQKGSMVNRNNNK